MAKTVVKDAKPAKTVEVPETDNGEMSPALKKKFEQADKLLRSADANFLKARYSLGEIVSDVEKDPKSVYGAKAIDKLRTALGVNSNILYKARRFTELYTSDDLTQIMSARGKGGQSINWSHMEVLVTVEDDDMRNELTEKVLKEAWTARDLGKEVKKLFGGSRSNSNGRPMSKPKHFSGYLDSVISVSQGVQKKTNTVWLSEEDNIHDAASTLSEINDDVMGKLQEAMDELAAMVISAETMVKELNDIREELLSRVTKAEQQVKANTKTFKKDEIDDIYDDESDEPASGAERSSVKSGPGVDEDEEDDEEAGDEEDEEFDEEDDEVEEELTKKIKARPGAPKTYAKR